MASSARTDSDAGRQIRPAIVTRGPGTREQPLFVGRHRELAQLHGALERTKNGQGSIALLVGEAGIGKTLTSEVFAREAVRDGAYVLRARCYESLEIPPYEPLRAALRAHIEQTGADALRAQLGRTASDIAQIAPELAVKLDSVDPSPALSPTEARFRLFQSMATFFQRIADTTPLILLADNLDWADAGTLQFLEHLSLELDETRILVVGTHRALTPHALLSGTMGELVKHNFFLRIEMTGLHSEEVAEYLQGKLPGVPDSETVQHVFDQTEGNPLFLVEMVRQMAHGRLLSTTDDVPRGVSHAIDRRIRKLPLECRDLLTAAAVVGRVFDLQVLAAITDTSSDRIIALLELAMQEGIVAESEEVARRFLFTHVLIQQAIVSWLSAARRSVLHQEIALALESLFGLNPGPHLHDLVYHLHQSGAENKKLVSYALRASETSLNDHAPQQALAIIDKAIMARAADDECGDRDRDLADLHHSKGIALASMTVKQEAAASLTRAFEIYRELGDYKKAVDVAITPANTEMRIGASSVWRRPHRGLRELTESAMALVVKGSAQHGWLLSHQGSVQALEQALAIAEETGDESLALWTMSQIARRHALAGRFDQGMDEQTQALILAEAQNDHTAIEYCRFWSHYACKLTGDRKGAQRHLDGLIANAQSARSQVMLFTSSRVSANFQLIAGDWASCRASVADNLSMPFADRRVHDSQMSLLDLALVELYTNGLDAARDYLHRLNDAFPDPGLPLLVALVAPKIARMTGDRSLVEQAIPVLDRTPGVNHLRQFPYGWTALAQSAAMATLATQQGNVDQMRFYLDHFSHVQSTLAPPNPLGQPTDGILGHICLELGRIEEAVRHYEDAAAFCNRAGYRPELAWTLFDGARATLRRGRAGDRSRATELLGRSRHIASDLDMLPLLNRIEELGAHPAAEVRGLTERQIDVLRLVARGLTNQEIGEALFISQGTVARHMHNILDRTGMSNRAEVTAYAIRHGLVD